MYNFFYIIFGNVEHREDKLSATPECTSYKSIILLCSSTFQMKYAQPVKS